MIPENDLWLLSFYRLSEINGAQFVGKLAGTLRNEKFRAQMTRHFAEEAQHAWYWTHRPGLVTAGVSISSRTTLPAISASREN